MKWSVVVIVFSLFGCGQSSDFWFESRELSPSEVASLGLSAAPDSVESKLPGGHLARNARSSSGIVNLLAGVVHNIIRPGETQFSAMVVGHAIPANANSFQLTQLVGGEKFFEKKLKSILGFTLVEAIYKVSYQYGGQIEGRGKYLNNVKVVPLRVVTDPIWSLSVTAVSDEPTNLGTASNPIANLTFTLVFTASGFGSYLVTDEFSLYGNSGELQATIRDFE